MLPRTTSGGYVPSEPETSIVPIAPMGFSHVLRLCLQGGGVYLESGTVSFSSCSITGNSAQYVRAHAQKFPSPRWKITDVLALTHACTTANASVNYSRYVPRCRSRYLEIPNCPDGKNAHALVLILACTTAANASVIFSMYVPQRTLKTSHRPDGKIADVLALTLA